MQYEAINRLKKCVPHCLTLDGTTNRASKQILNIMSAGPAAFFLEHFAMDMQRESADNLLKELLSSKRRLRVSLGLNPVMDIDDDEDVLMLSDPSTGLKSEPMWTITTDSPTVMQALRRKVLGSSGSSSPWDVHRTASTTCQWIG